MTIPTIKELDATWESAQSARPQLGLPTEQEELLTSLFRQTKAFAIICSNYHIVCMKTPMHEDHLALAGLVVGFLIGQALSESDNLKRLL